MKERFQGTFFREFTDVGGRLRGGFSRRRGMGMRGFSMRRYSRCTAFAGVLGMLLLVFASASAIAEDDDDEDTFEQKAIRGILGGLGVNVGGAGIEYRERSPLVIPPSRDLPPPVSEPTAVNNPAWPRQPEQQPRRKAANTQRPMDSVRTMEFYSASRLPPDEQRKSTIPGPPGSGGQTEPGETQETAAGRRSKPSELGFEGWGNWRKMFGFDYNKTESAPFAGEPARTTLTQPPVGYQTPSPNFPYGISPEQKSSPKAMVRDAASGERSTP